MKRRIYDDNSIFCCVKFKAVFFVDKVDNVDWRFASACGVMFRCGLQARSTVGVWVCLGFCLRGDVPLRAASPQHGRRMGVLGVAFAG